MEWEGFDALEPVENAATEESPGTDKTQTKPEEEPAQAEEFEPEVERKQRRQRPSPPELSESSDDESGDEYVDEDHRRKDIAGSGHMRKVRHHAWPSPDHDVLTLHCLESVQTTGASPQLPHPTLKRMMRRKRLSPRVRMRAAQTSRR